MQVEIACSSALSCKDINASGYGLSLPSAVIEIRFILLVSRSFLHHSFATYQFYSLIGLIFVRPSEKVYGTCGILYAANFEIFWLKLGLYVIGNNI